MQITFFDTKKYDKSTFKLANTNYHKFKFITKRLTLDIVCSAKGSQGVCCFVNCDGNREVLKKLKSMNILYWFQRATGYDNIDLIAAKEFGIKVFRVPSYSPESVAEHALTLLMALNRNVHLAYLRTTHKNFALEDLQGEIIHGQTIGVIGAGKIGQSFIKAIRGLGANVIVFDDWVKNKHPELAKKLNFKFVSKDEVFKNSNYLSLHVPLLPKTKNIINKDTLNLMKKSAIIINTSRGELINTFDLLNALNSGKLRGVGLDVYEKEKGIFFYDKTNEVISDSLLNKLLAHPNVIVTSHQGYLTNVALRQIARTTMKNVELAINNKNANTKINF